MKLMVGYKQTEVGVIPEAWMVAKVGDIGRVIRGASPRPKADRRFYGGKIPRLMVEDVTRDGKTVFPQVDFLTEEGAKRSRPCKTGTLTIVCSGTVGVPSFLGVDACIHDGFLALVSIRKSISSDYLYYQFDRLRLVFESSATHGGVFTNLTTAGVREFVVPFPRAEAEQRAIAEALIDVDALLGALDRLIAKKRDLKQAAVQQLLTGQTRLPGFSGKWEVKRLEDLGAWKSGMTPSMRNSGFWLGGTVPWISSGDVKSVLLNQTGFSITTLAVKQGATTMLPANSIVVVTRSGILRKYLPVAMNVVPMAINQDIKGLIPAERFNSLYLLYALIGYGDEILKRCMKAGTTVESVESRWLKAFTIPVPPLPEQTEIAAVLSDMDAELNALEQRRDKTRALKQGMMQELLTGRTRLV